VADHPPYPDTGDDKAAGSDPGLASSTSLWPKLLGVIVVAVILVVIVLHLAGVAPH
jgi:hypothetical protein